MLAVESAMFVVADVVVEVEWQAGEDPELYSRIKARSESQLYVPVIDEGMIKRAATRLASLAFFLSKSLSRRNHLINK